MLMQRIKTSLLAHHLAVLALLFLSLAPTISQLAAASSGTVNFQPSICTSATQSITIEVLTTKGQRLKTTFSSEPTAQPAPERNLVLHLEHCPYCALSADDHWLAILPSIAYTLPDHTYDRWQATAPAQAISSAVQSSFFSRAPPALS